MFKWTHLKDRVSGSVVVKSKDGGTTTLNFAAVRLGLVRQALVDFASDAGDNQVTIIVHKDRDVDVKTEARQHDQLKEGITMGPAEKFLSNPEIKKMLFSRCKAQFVLALSTEISGEEAKANKNQLDAIGAAYDRGFNDCYNVWLESIEEEL